MNKVRSLVTGVYRKVRPVVADVYGKTIWGAKYTLPGEKFLAAVLAPALYLIFVAMGVVGSMVGYPALVETYDTVIPWFSYAYGVWQWSLALISFGALIVPAYRTRQVESIASGLLLGQWSLYVTQLFFYGALNHDGPRLLIGFVTLIGIIALVTRHVFLRNEIKVYRIARLATKGE